MPTTISTDTASLDKTTGAISGTVTLSDGTSIPLSGTLTKGGGKTRVGSSGSWTVNATWSGDGSTVTGSAVSGSTTLNVPISMDHPGRSRRRSKAGTKAKSPRRGTKTAKSKPKSKAKKSGKPKVRRKAKAKRKAKVQRKAKARRRS